MGEIFALLSVLSVCLAVGMAVAANQIVKRQGRDGKIGAAVVASGQTIYEGTFVFEDAAGLASAVKVDATTTFLGIARNNAAAGEVVEFWRDGDFELTFGATLTAADLGIVVYASDNYTPTETSTANPTIGMLTKIISTTVGRVSIHGLGESIS